MMRPAAMARPVVIVPRVVTSSLGFRYEVLEKLGGGGNSDVYLVIDRNGPYRGILFALKLFTYVTDPTRLARFSREVDFLDRSSHPSIMKVYDRGTLAPSGGSTVGPFPFIIMDYLPRTLDHSMREGLLMTEKIAFALQLLSSLIFLSSRPNQIVHRDIKPQNIFVRGRSCMLGDFGLMKYLDDDDPDDHDFLIHSRGPRLPFFYRSPDLVKYCRDDVPLTTKSDVFQMGLVLAELFTGSNPCKRPIDKLDDVELYPLRNVDGSLGVRIRDQIQQMLQMEPRERPPAEDLMDGWEGIFTTAVGYAKDLEGRTF